MGGVARSHHVVVVACRGADCLVCARKNASGLDLLSEVCARERKRVREDPPSEEVKRCKSRTESVCAERCDEWLQTELGFTQLAIRYARNAFKRGERVIAMHYEDRRKPDARPVLCKNDKGHFYILAVVLRDANELSLQTRPWRSVRVAALNCGLAAKCLREMHGRLAAALAENEGALERVVAELQSGGF